MKRLSIKVEGIPTSYLTAGESGPLLLLLHGTYWSRVWQPVLEDLAKAGLRPVAVDLPGFGRSGGAPTPAEATVPALARWAVRFVEALGEADKPVLLGGHDIRRGLPIRRGALRATDCRRRTPHWSDRTTERGHAARESQRSASSSRP